MNILTSSKDNQVLTIGGLLVEIMRKELDRPLNEAADFTGPYPSGDTAIFISTAARLECPCAMIGVVGDDAFGQCITRRLSDDGVDTRYVRIQPDATTGTAFVAYNRDGSRRFIYHWRHAAAGMLSEQDIPKEQVARFNWVHITGVTLSVNENCRNAVYRLIDCISPQATVSFDPNIRPEVLSVDQIRSMCEPVVNRADIVFPSSGEARLFTDETDDDAGCRSLAARGKLVVQKCGQSGSRIYHDNNMIEIPAYKVTEVDPTGAGDSFCAGFITALIDGLPLDKAGRFANAVGALAVTKQGPMEGAPFRKDVDTFMKDAEILSIDS